MRLEAIAAARACLDTPFVHQGRIAGLALDCAGLGVHVMKVLGLPVVDFLGYGRNPHKGMLLDGMESQPALVRIPRSQSKAGDVLLIRIGSEPSHVAIQTGDDSIIHAYQTVGRVVEHRMDSHWRSTIVAAFEIVRPE